MDQDSVIAALEWWVKKAGEARSRTNVKTYDFGPRDSAKMKELREREDQTRRILHRVLGLETLPVILQGSGTSDSVWVVGGMTLCEYALGRLRTQAETAAMLGPVAPTMAADQLHPTIWRAASSLWDDGHYRAAVQKAATQLNADVQTKTGRYDVSDVVLMQQAFALTSPEKGKPRLRWVGDEDDLTVKAMRGGILNVAQGVYSAIRNPAIHGTGEMPRQVAFEQLATLSTLARWIDGCELVE